VSINTWCLEDVDGYTPSNVGGASKYGEGWNWGAFFCPGFWSFFHGAYLAGVLYWLLFVAFMPASWCVAIYLGIKGNEIALNKRGFANVHDFQATEKAWQYGGGALFVMFVLIQALYFIALTLIRARAVSY
jgi:hypothetical protein